MAVGTRNSALALWAFIVSLLPVGLWILSGIVSAAGVGGTFGVFGFLALPAPIAGLAMGIVARRDPTNDSRSRGLALAAIVISSVTLGLYVVAVIFFLILVAICASACASYHPCGVASAGPCIAGTTHASSRRRGWRGLWDDVRALDWRNDFSHHPDLPVFRADVWHVAGGRFCVGCATAFPVLVLGLAVLAVWPVAWPIAFLAGIPLGAVQLVSVMGWTRWRALKIVVKSCTGAGIALLFHGLMHAPGPELLRSAAAMALTALVFAAARPRQRRIDAALAAAREAAATA